MCCCAIDVIGSLPARYGARGPLGFGSRLFGLRDSGVFLDAVAARDNSIRDKWLLCSDGGRRGLFWAALAPSRKAQAEIWWAAKSPGGTKALQPEIAVRTPPLCCLRHHYHLPAVAGPPGARPYIFPLKRRLRGLFDSSGYQRSTGREIGKVTKLEFMT